MPKTLKFSQFVEGNPLTTSNFVVGLNQLANGQNMIWPFPGSGSGGTGVTENITQPGNVLAPGNWVTINTSGQYILAQADNSTDAECIGLVTDIVTPGEVFTVQQAGYITSASGIFTGLSPGNVYFLDPSIPGAMNINDVSVNGQISRPLFYADTSTSGWVLPYRGIIVSGFPPVVSGGGGSTDSNIITVTQGGHGFVGGEWVYLSSNLYEKGIGTSLATSQVVGLVINVVDASHFMLQFAGYFSNLTSMNVGGISPIAGDVYYLSVANAGQMQFLMPDTSSQFSKPVFICDNTAQKSGWILPQRPLGNAIVPVNPALESTTLPTSASITASGWTDIGLCATITTQTNTQNVAIFVKLNIESDGQNGVAFRIVRNNNPIDVGAAAGSRTLASGTDFGTQLELSSGIASFELFNDSPGLAGEYTYCVQVFKANSSAVAINQGDGDANSSNFFRTTSTILLMLNGN